MTKRQTRKQRQQRPQQPAPRAPKSADTVMHVGGVSPYDVVVGRDLAGRLPALLGESVERVAVLYAGSLGALIAGTSRGR